MVNVQQIIIRSWTGGQDYSDGIFAQSKSPDVGSDDNGNDICGAGATKGGYEEGKNSWPRLMCLRDLSL